LLEKVLERTTGQSKGCEDIESEECQSRLTSCSDGRCISTVDYDYVTTKGDKATTLYAVNNDGVAFGTVVLDPGSFDPGTRLRLSYQPASDNKLLNRPFEESKKSTCGGKRSEDKYSLATLTLSAVNQKGKRVQPKKPVQVSLSIPNVGENERRDIKRNGCLASTQEDDPNDPWSCEDRTEFLDYDSSKTLVLQSKVSHFTSFATLLGPQGDLNSACGKSYWIASVSLLATVPLLMALVFFGALATALGRKWIYGYKGQDINQVVNKIDNVSRQGSGQNITRQGSSLS